MDRSALTADMLTPLAKHLKMDRRFTVADQHHRDQKKKFSHGMSTRRLITDDSAVDRGGPPVDSRWTAGGPPVDRRIVVTIRGYT